MGARPPYYDVSEGSWMSPSYLVAYNRVNDYYWDGRKPARTVCPWCQDDWNGLVETPPTAPRATKDPTANRPGYPKTAPTCGTFTQLQWPSPTPSSGSWNGFAEGWDG